MAIKCPMRLRALQMIINIIASKKPSNSIRLQDNMPLAIEIAIVISHNKKQDIHYSPSVSCPYSLK